MKKLPNIIIAGNVPHHYTKMLNAVLSEEELADVCNLMPYESVDGQKEEDTLKDAMADSLDGKVEGIICLPMLVPATEIIRRNSEEEAPVWSMYINDLMRMTSILGDIDAEEASLLISREKVMLKLKEISKSLSRNFFITQPRLAVYAPENMTFENENGQTENIVMSAVNELMKEGIFVFSYSDTKELFRQDVLQSYDAIVGIYDSQFFEDFEQLTSGATLVITEGVKVPVVSADYHEVSNAIFTILSIARNRRSYDLPFANPLQKLYKERKEDGDKARFAIKKKGFNPAEHRRENVNYTTSVKPKS